MMGNLSNNGWIRLWRKLLTKRIWTETDPKEKTIMITLLLMANFEPTKTIWKGKEIVLKPGSMIVTLEDILYVSKTETVYELACVLDRFETAFDFLKQKKLSDDPHKRLITILNWKQYQQDGLSNEESEQRKDDALKLYNFYLEKIEPFHKTKVRAIANILKHSKRYSFKDLAKSINNYRPKAIYFEPLHRKDPANFFGIQEPYFKDFLPGAFDPKKISIYSDTNYQALPEALTPERLKELNA